LHERVEVSNALAETIPKVVSRKLAVASGHARIENEAQRVKYVAFPSPVLSDDYSVLRESQIDISQIPKVFDSQTIDAHQVPYIR